MPFIWDYDIKELRRSKQGRLLILERQINYGVFGKEKIILSEVKKNWKKLKTNMQEKRL